MDAVDFFFFFAFSAHSFGEFHSAFFLRSLVSSISFGPRCVVTGQRLDLILESIINSSIAKEFVIYQSMSCNLLEIFVNS